jgi:hypothetical protein
LIKLKENLFAVEQVRDEAAIQRPQSAQEGRQGALNSVRIVTITFESMHHVSYVLIH